MGEVYLAERADAQFEQQVAIKVVHGGAIAATMHSRLKLERQILAQLDHPNIAHLLDGGALPDGSAYIVMEYVDGVAIDVFCDTKRLDINARLKLFQTVCAAVHYAHQNLIVHRDLKPSNILVRYAVRQSPRPAMSTYWASCSINCCAEAAPFSSPPCVSRKSSARFARRILFLRVKC
jgi:serine/threonine protein kinase